MYHCTILPPADLAATVGCIIAAEERTRAIHIHLYLLILLIACPCPGGSVVDPGIPSSAPHKFCLVLDLLEIMLNFPLLCSSTACPEQCCRPNGPLSTTYFQCFQCQSSIILAVRRIRICRRHFVYCTQFFSRHSLPQSNFHSRSSSTDHTCAFMRRVFVAC